MVALNKLQQSVSATLWACTVRLMVQVASSEDHPRLYVGCESVMTVAALRSFVAQLRIAKRGTSASRSPICLKAASCVGPWPTTHAFGSSWRQRRPSEIASPPCVNAACSSMTASPTWRPLMSGHPGSSVGRA
jgi:hypothetical protein